MNWFGITGMIFLTIVITEIIIYYKDHDDFDGMGW